VPPGVATLIQSRSDMVSLVSTLLMRDRSLSERGASQKNNLIVQNED